MPILTINVAERGTPLYDPTKPDEHNTSNVGHMWYSITDKEHHHSYGFSPAEGAHGLQRLLGEGTSRLNQEWGGDDVHYTKTVYSVTVEINQDQFNNLKDLGEHPEGYGFATYNALINSCVDYGWKGAQIADLNPSGYEGRVWPTHNVPKLMEMIREELQHQQNGWIVEKHGDDTQIWCLTNPHRPEGDRWSCEKDTQGQAQVLINGALGKGPSIFSPQEPRLTPAPIEHRELFNNKQDPQQPEKTIYNDFDTLMKAVDAHMQTPEHARTNAQIEVMANAINAEREAQAQAQAYQQMLEQQAQAAQISGPVMRMR